MHRIDNSTAADTLPTPGAVGPKPNGYFTGGDPATGTASTILTADWANSVQEEIANAITAAGLTLSKTDTTQLAQAIAAGGGGGGGSGTDFSKTITQNAHGIGLGKAVRLDTSSYVLANASNAVNAEAIGFTTEIIDANSFKMQFGGYISGVFAGLTAGTVYFLSTTAGAITATPPDTLEGQVVRPMLLADSATSGFILPYRGNVVEDSLVSELKIRQIAESSSNIMVSGITATIPNTTVPQITDGVEVITASITPSSAANKLIIEFYCPVVSSSGSGIQVYTLCQTGVTNALQVATTSNVNNSASVVYVRHEMLAGSTSPLTFSLRAGWNSGSGLTIGFLKGWTGTEYQYSGLNKMTLKITEIE